MGSDVDYAQLVKYYGNEATEYRRYGPRTCTKTKVKRVRGNPDMGAVSTSYIGRQNLTMRVSMRRFTRLTNGFSKEVENYEYALALNFMYYDFVRPHKALANPYPRTPAMTASITDHIWTVEELISLIDW